MMLFNDILLFKTFRIKQLFYADEHSNALQRLVVGRKRLPVYTISIRSMFSIVVETIQVANVTFVVPPGTFKTFCAVMFRVKVMVGIVCCKLPSVLPIETIPCGSSISF